MRRAQRGAGRIPHTALLFAPAIGLSILTGIAGTTIAYQTAQDVLVARHYLPVPKSTMNRNLNSAPIDDCGEPPDDQGMEARIKKLETDLASVKIDVAVIKATCATKSDLAEAKTSIIIWVVSAFFLAQLIPSPVKVIESHI